MTPNISREKWVLAAGQLEWEQWDDIHIVFQHAAGKTHFLNAVSHLLLQRLGASPQDSQTAANDIAQELGFDADAEFVDQIEKTLTRLEQLGLISKIREAPVET